MNAPFQTCAGQVDLLDFGPAFVSLQVIAYHLARINRFSGGAEWSVAQHSLLGQSLTDDPLEKVYFMLHDAHEAYTGDITASVKQALPAGAVMQIDALNDRIQSAILEHFSVPLPTQAMLARVKELDDRVLALELDGLFGKGRVWRMASPIAGDAGQVEKTFMGLFRSLTERHADRIAASGAG